MSQMHNPNAGIMMNNFAGPSDTQNFAENNAMNQGDDTPVGTDNSDTPFMGNHVVKTVRNLRMR